MLTIQEQFSFQVLPNHFERDTHLGIQGLNIEKIQILSGESPHEDILVVLYQGSPNLSFYDVHGRLIDVDHYLPDDYVRADLSGVDAVISNLKNLPIVDAKSKGKFGKFLSDTFKAGRNDLAAGLRKLYGLETTEKVMRDFKKKNDWIDSSENFQKILTDKFDHFYQFLEAFIVFQQKNRNGYVHFTTNDNIIITPLNKRMGISVIIETQDVDGNLLSPNQWIITRTKDENSLNQALVFRSDDVQAFFDADGFEEIFETDRYKLYHSSEKIAIDSLLDNTDNLLKLNVLNDCFQILASDKNIIIVLSHEQEVTVVNTHLSVVPHKWSRKIVLPEKAVWARADENLNTIFIQKENGEIIVFDITGDHANEIDRLGEFTFGFELDQNGSVLALSSRENAANQLLKINTNANDLEVPSEQQNFVAVLKNLSHLFKGESIFTQKQFAKIVTEEKPKEEEKLPSAFDQARFDFETNVEYMLVEAGNDYEELLTIQNKIAVARQNIGEELINHAEKEGVFLVGQRLQKALNSILRPAEKKVRDLVEESRATVILEESKIFQQDIYKLTDPNSYRDILNSIRQFQEELNSMLPQNSDRVMTEFKEIQQELNKTFSQQIASDGNALQSFITSEIEQIETAIKNTHNPRQLEVLLSTHPASLELMTLLKQPFILENIAKEKSLSPAGIQSRLYQSVAIRKGELIAELERKEAERNAAKLQLANMVNESIDFFVINHSSGFSDLELRGNATYQQILGDILKLEKTFKDIRLAIELRRKLERRILERNRADLEKMVAFEGKYAYIQNDPDLFVDMESSIQYFPTWEMRVMEKKGMAGVYQVIFERDTDHEIYRPSATENLEAGKAFEIEENDYASFAIEYKKYCHSENVIELLECLWKITMGQGTAKDYPQFDQKIIEKLLPLKEVSKKGLRCALEKKSREQLEKTRTRSVPIIGPEFIDETPYFQNKLHEFVIKVKLQMVSESGIILFSGPPSTGKSMFLKFAASIMNREYFEHAADKWQTKNSLVTAVKFGDTGPYATPAGFVRAITTSHSLVNIEEIKEWTEALRKSLNPFFAGSKIFVAQDGTNYKIGDNVLLCAAANLGSMYREDDEPFTADFWSRIEVVEYDYAPEKVDREYLQHLHVGEEPSFLTMQDLVRHYFGYHHAPANPQAKAMYFSKKFLEFTLLPKMDEKVKRESLQSHLREFFIDVDGFQPGKEFSPEEATKIALRRLKDFQGYSAKEFYDLYDHFANGQNLRSQRLAQLQSDDIDKYEQLKILILCLRYLEGALRRLREKFYSSAGQTEIEGTNREFIKCVYLMGLMGKF